MNATPDKDAKRSSTRSRRRMTAAEAHVEERYAKKRREIAEAHLRPLRLRHRIRRAGLNERISPRPPKDACAAIASTPSRGCEERKQLDWNAPRSGRTKVVIATPSAKSRLRVAIATAFLRAAPVARIVSHGVD